MFCKAPSCAKLIGMINADHMAITDMRGGLQINRVFFVWCTCTPREHVCGGLHRGM